MSKTIKLRRGFDLKLIGAAEPALRDTASPRLFALKPTDLHGLMPIPKLMVQEGDEIKAGDPLYFDKPAPEVMYASPVSGEVVEIRRAAKRAISAVVILADAEMRFREFGPMNPATASRDAIVARLLESGAWPLIRQRPFNVVPDIDAVPRDIFVSCFGTGPLAPDYGLVLDGQEADFEAGLAVLRQLTTGDVHLGIEPKSDDWLRELKGVRIHSFSGPHPAGNVGVQIHHVAPINKGETVWTVKPQDVLVIGRLFSKGVFDTERLVAITGSEIQETGYVRTRLGAQIKPFVEDNVDTSEGRLRYISGDVLTGTTIDSDGFLSLFDDQLTVIPEGDDPEFLGWLLPSYPRPSTHRLMPSFFSRKPFKVNTNMHGEPRPLVVSGEYEDVVPMDLLPMQLIKSIVYNDFEQMEGLGIYEVVEEDLALCEFACTSKTPVQQILREGLDMVRLDG
ncbi:MAG: Na(+)-translocating NADH-quinone reductase subunit A [Bacteroidota bacterium]